MIFCTETSNRATGIVRTCIPWHSRPNHARRTEVRCRKSESCTSQTSGIEAHLRFACTTEILKKLRQLPLQHVILYDGDVSVAVHYALFHKGLVLLPSGRHLCMPLFGLCTNPAHVRPQAVQKLIQRSGLLRTTKWRARAIDRRSLRSA